MLFPYIPHMCSIIVSPCVCFDKCCPCCFHSLNMSFMLLSRAPLVIPCSLSKTLFFSPTYDHPNGKAKCNLYVSNICLPLCFNFISCSTCNFYHVSH
jgi:hypothetical protein